MSNAASNHPTTDEILDSELIAEIETLTLDEITPSLQIRPYRNRQAIYFRSQRIIRHKTGGAKKEEELALWAPWTVDDVRRRRFWDCGDTTWRDSYEVSIEGRCNKQVTLSLEQLASANSLNAATLAVGGLAQGGSDSFDDDHGSAVMQFREYLADRSQAASDALATNRLGRIDHPSFSKRSVYVLPDVTLCEGGATGEVTYDEVRPNRVSRHLAVTSDPQAKVDELLSSWLTAALEADPSAGWQHTAAVVGWAAAASTATRLIETTLVGGFPLLWTHGTPGSGKTARVPRLLAPFGQRPNSLATGISGYAQCRDTFSASCDVPWVLDEVKLAYLSRGAKFTELMKDAYNAGRVLTGGQFGDGLNASRQMRLFPSVAFLSEDVPAADTAIADRVVLVRMQRREMLDDAVKGRTKAGFKKLIDATNEAAMAPVAGAWYSWVASQDVRQIWNGVAAHEGLAQVDERKASNFRCVLFGLELFRRFLAAKAPGTEAAWTTLTEAFRSTGLEDLIAEVTDLSGRSGAVGCFADLANLSVTHAGATAAPAPGIHYIVDDDGLWVQPKHVISALKKHPVGTVSDLPSASALTTEIEAWRGVHKGRRRRAGGRNPLNWFVIPWTTLEELGGPSKDDFYEAPTF